MESVTAHPAYVELPPLNMLPSLFTRDDHYELGNLAAIHPLFELRHDLFDVCLDLVIGRDHHCQPIFLDPVNI